MARVVKKPGFSFGWKSLTTRPTPPTKDGYYKLRPWQERGYNYLKDGMLSILNAPTGSGKTWLMCLLSVYKMRLDDSLRTIIVVPQTIIGSGFSEARLLMTDKSKLHWFANHDLCFEPPNEGTVKYVIDWLKNPRAFFQDRILICTHATVVEVYKRLKKTKQLKLLRNLNCWVDEAHHIQNAEIEGYDSAVSNKIGELVNHLVRYSESKNIHVGLATASFFRGDRFSVLTSAMQERFIRFNLPYDEHLESMEYLKTFSFDFVLCGPDYVKAIRNIIKDNRKDIIHIPHPVSRHSTGDKYSEVKKIIACYQKEHKGKEIELDNGLTVLRKKSGEFKILDLVDEDRRSAKKSFVRSLENREDLDAIIALSMFKEGANWIWADRSIIVGPRASVVDLVQIIGRLLRDAPGKDNVKIVQLLPFALDQRNDIQFQDKLNDYLKAILASLVLEDILHPIKIKIKDKKESGEWSRPSDWLSDALPDVEKQIALREDIRDKLLTIIVHSEDNKVSTLWKEYQKVFPDVLTDYGISENIDEIGAQIWAGFARRTLQMQGIDTSHINFNLLMRTHPLEFMTRYTSGVCGIKTLRDLRRAIGFNSAEDKKLVLLARGAAGLKRPTLGGDKKAAS